MYASALNFLCGFTEPGLHRTCPRSTASLSIPRNRQPTLSPATPSSRSLRNISTPVTTDFCVSRSPTFALLPAERLDRSPADHRDLVAGKLVLGQKLAHLQLHQIEKLGVVNHVHLVEKNHDVGNTNLARQ